MKNKVKAIILSVSVVVLLLIGLTQKGNENFVIMKRQILLNNYIDTNTEEFHDNFIDMREVIDFITTEYGVQIILANGEGYYWER